MSNFSQNNTRALQILQSARCLSAIPMFDLSIAPTNHEINELNSAIWMVRHVQKNNKLHASACRGTSNLFQIFDPTSDYHKNQLIKKEINRDCKICYNLMRNPIFCKICKFAICTTCYLSIIETNHGISKCAQCRYETPCGIGSTYR